VREVREVTPRLITVWCPDWPVVAAVLAGGAGVAGVAGVAGGSGGHFAAAVLHANRVVARSPVAARAGVQVGQRRRDAQRCCPELVLVDHDPARDAREFEPVLRAVAELAPRLDVIEPGWITLAARGPSRYFGGDQAVAERLAGLVSELIGGETSAPAGGGTGGGAGVGVGVADGRAASSVAARRAAAPGHDPPVVVVPPGVSPEYLAPLPISWLGELGDARPDLLDVWRRLGLRTLGDLAALPAADVLARFSRAGAHAHRLAGGTDDRPPVVVDPPLERRVERVFDEPVLQVAPVVFVAKQLADELVAGLAAEGRVCTRLLVVAETEHGERSERSWYRDGGLSAAAMVERVRWQLDGWITRPDAGISAGIALIRLVPDEVRADDGVQVGLWGGRSQADHDAARAITRLVGLAGDHAVLVPAWNGGRLPADRYRWVPASSVDLEYPAGRLTPGAGTWPGATPSPSPAVVPTQPTAIDVLDAEGHSVRVGGRGEVSAEPVALVVAGARRMVTAWAGPWPLDQAWWDPRRRRRVARLQVVTDDGSAHLVAVEQQRWSIIATYA
jgi:protein ImuB